MQAGNLVRIDVAIGPGILEVYWPDTAKTTNPQSLSLSQRRALNEAIDATVDVLSGHTAEALANSN